MGKDHGGGVVGQGCLDHFTRIDAGPVDGAAEQFAKFDDAMLVIQQQAGKDFVLVGAHLGGKVLPGQFTRLRHGYR